MAKRDKDQSADEPQLAGGNPHQPPPSAADPAYLGIESGVYWGTSPVTYSFPDSASDYGKGYSEANKFVKFSDDSAKYHVNEIAAFQPVIDQFTKYTLLNLVPTNSDSTADIRIGKTVTQGADAWSYYPGTGKGGDVWFNRNDAGVTNGGKGGMDWAHLQPGDYTYTVFMHEFGHSVGLKHSFEKSGAGAVPKAYDSLEYTVMSYDAYQTINPFDPASVYDSSVDQRNWWADNGNNPQTLMMLDIAALQDKYGVDYDTTPGDILNGDTVYKWNPATGETSINGAGQGVPTANKIFMTIWDGNGNDTYNFEDYGNLIGGSRAGVSIDLRPGHWVTIDYNDTTNPDQRADLLAGSGTHWATGDVANALVFSWNDDAPAGYSGAGYIENAIGGHGDDILIGSDVANELTGGDGNDFFVFNSLIGIDTVTDFHKAVGDYDRLQFDNSPGAFTAAGVDGWLSDNAFYADTGGFGDETALDRFLYDTTNGRLYYDDDGLGGHTAIQIALLLNAPALSYTDFQIV